MNWRGNFTRPTRSPSNRQRLEFVDDNPSRVGSVIAGEGSPVIQGGIAAKLAQLDRGYSGVILAKRVDASNADLLERLVRTQFQQTRVYTLESFHESHWRYVPLEVIDPVWPLQTGFQLARISPYHYVKRLFDLVFSGVVIDYLFSAIGCPDAFGLANEWASGDFSTASRRPGRTSFHCLQVSDDGNEL